MNIEDLPKLGAPVNLQFWSLRGSVGESLGFVEVDEKVTRKCRRVRCRGGWKFQIIDFYDLLEWDYYVDTDQETLNDIGMDLSAVDILTPSA